MLELTTEHLIVGFLVLELLEDNARLACLINFGQFTLEVGNLGLQLLVFDAQLICLDFVDNYFCIQVLF